MGDKSRLADDEGARYARTRDIMFDGEISVRVLAVPPESGQGSHNRSVLEGDGANLDGLKKLRCSHCSVGQVCALEVFWELLHPLRPLL